MRRPKKELTPEILKSIGGFIGRESMGEEDLPEAPLMTEIRARFENKPS